MTRPRNLGDILGARRDSDEVAVISLDAHARTEGAPREWQAREIEQGSLAYGEAVRRRGLPTGSAVGIFAQNSVPNLMAYLGILRAGYVCVPVNIRQPAPIVHYVCEDADMRFAFADEASAALVPETVEHASLTPVPDPVPGPQAGFPAVEEASTALILYTSGSTGRPKGVVLSHISQLSMVDAVTAGPDSRLFDGQRGIVAAPMFHMNAQVFIASFLTGGGSVVLLSRFDATLFAAAIADYGVHVLTGVPTMIALLHSAWRDLGRPALDSVRTVYIGSAPVTEAIIGQSREMMPNAKVLNSYGTTETGGGLFGPHPDGVERPPTSVGYPTPLVDARLDEDGALLVRAPSMMAGYLNLPELTAQRLQDGWYNTGDLFERDADGFYFFRGRVDDMFVCSGENVYPGEVEHAVESHPGVLQAAVVPVADARRGQMPVAFVVPAGDPVDGREIQDHVTKQIAPYLYPRRVWFLDALPLASTTKVDRRELMRRAEEFMQAEETGQA